MRRSFAAVAIASSLVVSALTASSAYASASSIAGGGSSFQANFEYKCAAAYSASTHIAVSYDGTLGSGTGMANFHAGTKDFAGIDGPDLTKTPADGGNAIVVPITAAPVAIAYHVKGKNKKAITGLRITPAILSGIYRGDITTWNDATIAAANPSLKKNLPATPILAEYRANGSGTTKNLLSYLAATNPSAGWVASKNFNTPEANTVKVATSGAAQANSDAMVSTLKSTNGAIGYADLPDTVGAKGFQIATLKNAAGAYVKPTIAAGTKLVKGITADKFNNGSNVGFISGTDATNVWNTKIKGAYQLTVVTYLQASDKASDTNTAVKNYATYALTKCQGKAGFSSLKGTPALAVATAQVAKISSH